MQFLAALLVLAATSANAESPSHSESTRSPRASKHDLASSADATAIGIAPLSEGELAAIAGGTATNIAVLTVQNLEATLTNNTVSAGSIQNGELVVSPNAFNFNGIGNFLFNTGTSNVLQGTVSLSVVPGPPP